MRIDDAGSPWIDTLEWVQVDLAGLHDFAETLRSDVEGHLRVQADGVIVEHSTGVPFGWGTAVSGSVAQIQQRYRDCLVGGAEALMSYIERAEAMIAGALEVATRYGDADALARAKVEEVKALLARGEERALAEGKRHHADERTRAR
jgi:hypothetical protein